MCLVGWTVIVQPRGVPQSYLTLNGRFCIFLHPGALFEGPREEHLMMVLFSSHRWYPKYRVAPETSGLPEILGNTRCFGLPATRWFPKLNRVGSGIDRNTGYRVGFGYPLGTAPKSVPFFKKMLSPEASRWDTPLICNLFFAENLVRKETFYITIM